jgi:glycosyltransferase involved in cell wall biosynthesis
MKITYLASPITSQYGGGEKFLDDFTTGIDGEHEFIGSSKAVYDLFISKGYKATLTWGIFEPALKTFLLMPISIIFGVINVIRFYKVFKNSDWIISPTAHSETIFVIPWIKLLFKKKVIFMVHAPKVPKTFSFFPMNLILSKCWGSSPVVFVSNSQKELWNRAGCNSSIQIVIYNGVKITDFEEICGGQIPLVRGGSEADGVFAEEASNPPDGIFHSAQDDETFVDSKSKTIKIGFLARLHKEKGCDVFINALESIKSTKEIEIIIAGDGPEKDNLVTLYEAKRLPKNIKVTFVGFQSDTRAFYESLDLLVFPSRREGFSLVLLEAWERGLSVLTSDIKPFLEAKKFQSEMEQRLIFELDNRKDLAAKIDYFIENQKVYLDSDYMQQLHDTIDKRFGLERMICEYEKILKV